MAVDDVRAHRQSDKTLAAPIEEKGLNKEQVLQTLFERGKSCLEGEVSSGKMTQEQADRVLEDLRAKRLEAWEWSGRQQPSAPDRQQGGQPPQSRLVPSLKSNLKTGCTWWFCPGTAGGFSFGLAGSEVTAREIAAPLSFRLIVDLSTVEVRE
ncbi:hypothetical protein V3F56_05980 [Moorellaceae bacterium AZ2]